VEVVGEPLLNVGVVATGPVLATVTVADWVVPSRVPSLGLTTRVSTSPLRIEIDPEGAPVPVQLDTVLDVVRLSVSLCELPDAVNESVVAET
jgi:hypothetical protein